MIEHSQYIAGLIYKHIHGSLNAQEKSELDQWIGESGENAWSFKLLTDKGIYDQVRKDFDDVRLVAAAERISARVGFEVRPYIRKHTKVGRTLVLQVGCGLKALKRVFGW